MEIVCQLLWVIPGILGALLGVVIPPEVKGMDFALTALFVVLAYESFTSNRDFSLPLTATAIAILVAVIAPSWLLMVALTAYFFVLLLRYALPNLDRALELRPSHEGGQ